MTKKKPEWKLYRTHIRPGFEYYSVDNVKKLYEKLISDIQMELYSKNGMEFNHGIKEIINKRFGIKCT